MMQEGKKWRTWASGTRQAKKFSRMKLIMDEHRSLRDDFGLNPDQACLLMQRGMDKMKSFSAFADKISKISREARDELYGGLPENENAAAGEDAMEGHVGEEEVATVSDDSGGGSSPGVIVQV
jgi:hypothetical protein